VVRVTDQFGNPYPDGQPILFAVTSGWPTVGSQTMSVVAPGLTAGSPANFTATGESSTATTIVKADGDNQTGLVAKDVNVPPTVQVRDRNDVGVSGVNVTFTVTSGGGTVDGGASTNVTTDANGIARVTSWTPGAAPGANALQASASVGSVSFAATGQTAAFNIIVRYYGSTVPTPTRQAAFTAAEARWEQLVFGDLDDIPSFNIPAGECKRSPSDPGLPAVNEPIDDVIIYARIDSIDGPGTVLGSAGPCYVRSGGNHPALTVLGVMRFDPSDVLALEANNQQNLTILHEMGHVLGFGTLWNRSPFALLSDSGQADPYFNGARAIAAFDRVGGTNYVAGPKVPVENTGGDGTRDSHWRESVFDRELMTGFLDVGPSPQPISIVSLGSLWDMNYLVAYANTDSYAWPAPPALRVAGAQVMLREILEGPLYAVDTAGRVTRLRP
jgi:hypothetical protein